MATPMLSHHLLEPCPPIFPPNTPVGVVVDAMVRYGSKCVLVMDAEHLIGIFTAWDVVRWLTHLSNDKGRVLDTNLQLPMLLMQVPLGDYMSQPVVTIPVAALNDWHQLHALFVQTGLRYLPVLDSNDYPVGLVSWATMMAMEWLAQQKKVEISSCLHPTLSQSKSQSNWSDLSPLPEVLLQRSESAVITPQLAQRLQQILAMGHDLRSPLNVILGLTQLMTSSPEITPDQRVNIETISNHGYQLLGLINQLLRLAQHDPSSAIGPTSHGSVSNTRFPGDAEDRLSMANHQPKLSSRRIIGLAPNQPSYRVLIVDDQPVNCRLLQAFLSVLKVDVQEAHDGKSAIALWEAWHPHLIWMDVQMPVMNGYEATKAIRQLEQAQANSQTSTASDPPRPIPTKIIALTASARKDEDELAKAAGCDDFVRKPFSTELFFDKMALHLGWQYCYQGEFAEVDSQTDVSPDLSNHTAHTTPSIVLEPADFQIMSADWIEKIYRAALGCDDSQIRQLLTEIPHTHAEFRHKLDVLIHNYQFDQIIYSVTAIQTSAGNAYSKGNN